MEHSFLAPSGLEQTVGCPASPKMKELYPERKDSDDAREGTAAHWMQESTFGKECTPHELVGTNAPNGVELTAEMADAVDIFQCDLGDRREVCIERRVTAARIHSDCWGTLDAGRIRQRGTRWLVTIWDFKYGRRYVSAFENSALITYGVGLAHDLDLANVDFDFRIVQPRCPDSAGVVRSWKISGERLKVHIDRLHDACAMATTVNPDFKTGPWCTNCSAIGECPAAQRATLNAIDVMARWQEPQSADPASLSADTRTLERAYMMITARLDSRLEDVEYRLSNGQRVPNYFLKTGEAHRSWTIKNIIKVGAQLKYDLTRKAAPCTPAEAERRGVDEKFINTFTTRKPTKLRVAYDDGKSTREALSK